MLAVLTQDISEMAQIDHCPFIVLALGGNQLLPDTKLVQAALPCHQKSLIQPHLTDVIELLDIMAQTLWTLF